MLAAMQVRQPIEYSSGTGIRSESRIAATGQNGSSRHVSAPFDTRSEAKMETKQRTLNLRAHRSSYRVPPVISMTTTCASVLAGR